MADPSATDQINVNKRTQSRGRSGPFVVAGMIAIAVFAALFAWWWNYERGSRALKFYGPDAATLIRTAAKVEVTAGARGDWIDVSKSPGLLNARTSLLNDASYRWEVETIFPPLDSPAVRFSDARRSVTIRFCFPAGSIHTSSTDRAMALNGKTAKGWQKYIQRQLDGASDKTRGTD